MKTKVFSLALKDDRIEQCLRSRGSEFQMWGPKYESHESCICTAGFSACGCWKKGVVYEMECRCVAVQKGKQPFITLKHIQVTLYLICSEMGSQCSFSRRGVEW